MQTSPRVAALPSFGSVFGEDKLKSSVPSVKGDANNPHGGLARPATSPQPHVASFSSFHAHHDSRDSTSTASSDNSPTTTISTMDSSSATDPSPGPSPESPVAKTSSSSFVADFRSRRTDNGSQESSPSAFFELQRPTTPAKKPRNLKNLGINTSTSLSNLRTSTTASSTVAIKPEKNSSAPPSPLFIKPPTPPKRRPSNLSLTLSTPGSNDGKPMRLVIPSAPTLNRPALRHFQSSPSLPLCSPAVGPATGMQLPALRTTKTHVSGLSEVPYEMEEEEDQEPNFDVPQSREEKPAAYPNGPIQIYPSGIFLYFEPTAVQACTFDVIINVASEVRNPFTTSPSDLQKDLDARRVDGPPAENPDFATLPDKAAAHGSSPSTPKATPILETAQTTGEYVEDGKTYRTPEYIHMMWEHNTDIVPDLHRLVKIMDDRVSRGKRILVHCQCGVSRSASLIVAYGLYKNPAMSVQETYDIVKKRSKWIGPNMNLIMQLQEFGNVLLKTADSRSHLGQSFGRRSAGLSTATTACASRHSPFERDAPSAPRTPRTAPLPPDSDMSMQRASTGNMMMVSPGPTSAPSGSLFSPGFRQSWAASQTHFDTAPKSSPAFAPDQTTTRQIVPILSVTEDDPAQAATRNTGSAASTINDSCPSPRSVPNFSRQLPIRNSTLPEFSTGGLEAQTLRAPMAPLGFGALHSPAVPTFSFPTLSPESPIETSLTSPTQTQFTISPWLRSHERNWQDPEEASGTRRSESPRSTFCLPGATARETEETPEPFSPRASTFSFDWPETRRADADNQGIFSPIKAGFPADVFGPDESNVDHSVSSPRATEFQMTPLIPLATDEDRFGITSPRLSGVAGDSPPGVFAPHEHIENDFRRPSFQAILPPSHLAQPESVNGFASLDGTAQPSLRLPGFPPMSEHPKPKSYEADTRIDSVSTSPEPQVVETDEMPAQAVQSPEETPQTPRDRFLATPARQPAIRTRFSSPNLRQQRKLQKLQTEMEDMLPKRTGLMPQAADDLDALMSPRAEEFTRNPFHYGLAQNNDEPSPASSNETIKGGLPNTQWADSRQWTPQKSLEDDPRSPVHTGSSPITRSIFDVL